MRDAAIFNAVKEAQRFLKAVDAHHARVKADKASGWYSAGTKESGAVKRASLDLSRALSELRKP